MEANPNHNTFLPWVGVCDVLGDKCSLIKLEMIIPKCFLEFHLDAAAHSDALFCYRTGIWLSSQIAYLHTRSVRKPFLGIPYWWVTIIIICNVFVLKIVGRSATYDMVYASSWRSSKGCALARYHPIGYNMLSQQSHECHEPIRESSAWLNKKVRMTLLNIQKWAYWTLKSPQWRHLLAVASVIDSRCVQRDPP